MPEPSVKHSDPHSPQRRWIARLAGVAGQLIDRSDRPASEQLFDLIAGELGLDVFVHYEVAPGGLRLSNSHGLSGVEAASIGRLSWGEGIAGRVASEGRPIYLPDVQDTDDPAAEFARNIGVNAYVCFPLATAGRIVGTIGFGRRWSGRFEPDELDFLEAATSCIATIELHRRAELELAANEERLRLALELGDIGSFDWNLLTGEGSASEGCYAIFGYGPETTPTYSNVLKVILPEDSERFRADIATTVRSGEGFNAEVRIMRPGDDRVRWIRVDGGVVRCEQGRATRMVGIVRDVTARRQAQEREQLLTREVDHRAKNLLTVVQSVVQLTRADDIEAFREAVSGRIQALGRAHSLLAASRWEGAELTTLVDEEVAPFVEFGGRVSMEGPPVLLRPAAAQSVALVLHELVTNAAKYGALSTSSGRVEVNWSLDRASDERLVLRWSEAGGPPATAPVRKGFGTTVIQASVERQLGGQVRYDWRRDGLYCELVIPAKQLAAAGRRVPAEAPASPDKPAIARIHSPKVLVVEDEPLIALQIAQTLERMDCQVVGPAATVGEALELINAGGFDLALLDVDLSGSRSFPLADLLEDQGRPFAFLTGFGAAELPQRFHRSPLLGKPICSTELDKFVLAATGAEPPTTGERARAAMTSTPPA